MSLNFLYFCEYSVKNSHCLYVIPLCIYRHLVCYTTMNKSAAKILILYLGKYIFKYMTISCVNSDNIIWFFILLNFFSISFAWIIVLIFTSITILYIIKWQWVGLSYPCPQGGKSQHFSVVHNVWWRAFVDTLDQSKEVAFYP